MKKSSLIIIVILICIIILFSIDNNENYTNINVLDDAILGVVAAFIGIIFLMFAAKAYAKGPIKGKPDGTTYFNVEYARAYKWLTRFAWFNKLTAKEQDVHVLKVVKENKDNDW